MSMHELQRAALDNLLSPMVLFFALGFAAARLKSDLEIPAGLGKGLSIYLMLAIGQAGAVNAALPAAAILALGEAELRHRLQAYRECQTAQVILLSAQRLFQAENRQENPSQKSKSSCWTSGWFSCWAKP